MLLLLYVLVSGIGGVVLSILLIVGVHLTGLDISLAPVLFIVGIIFIIIGFIGLKRVLSA